MIFPNISLENIGQFRVFIEKMTGFLVFVRTICYLCSVVRIILVMRKLLLFLVLAAMSIASQNVDAQDRVKEIRKMYADALQDLNAMKEEPHQVNTVEIRNTAAPTMSRISVSGNHFQC